MLRGGSTGPHLGAGGEGLGGGGSSSLLRDPLVPLSEACGVPSRARCCSPSALLAHALVVTCSIWRAAGLNLIEAEEEGEGARSEPVRTVPSAANEAQ